MTNRRIVPYLPRLFGYAVSITLNRDAARDLVQECALRALRAARVPSDEAAFRAWLFKILRNVFVDHHRQAARRATIFVDDPDADHAPGWRHDETLINAITVRNGLRRLDPAHREIVTLIDISGFSYAEAAGLLEVPVGTVMSRLSRARRALLGHLEENNVHVLHRNRKISSR